MAVPGLLVGGRFDGPTVLHFHSPGAYPFEVEGLISLADEAGVRVVGIDRDALPAATVGPVAAVAVDALEALGRELPERFSIVAWSGGAPFALAVAAIAPARVQRLVLACPLPGWLRGNGAINPSSPRLASIASGTLAAPAKAAKAALDVIAEPWGIDLADVSAPVDVWYGDSDEVIPPALIEAHLLTRPNFTGTLFVGETHFLPMGRWADMLRASVA